MRRTNDILIADAGGTSTRWCLIGNNGEVKRDLNAAPLNACVLSDQELIASLRPIEPLLASVSHAYIYAAGCTGLQQSTRISDHMRILGYQGYTEAHSDMLGAARALLGDSAGLACILGTGSNSCLYDGRDIVAQVSPLGYILGDEGGGAAIGKRFLKALIRGDLSADLTQKFLHDGDITVSDIYEKVYRTPFANKYLASIVLFVHEHISDPTVEALVKAEFDEFFENILNRYSLPTDTSIGFIGSVAYYFEPILRSVAVSHGYEISTVLRTPMQGLQRYHSHS